MKCKIKDIAKVTMGQSPESIWYNSDGEGIPFLQGNRTFGDKYPTFDTWTKKVTKIGEPYSVIMSVRAPVGDINIIKEKVCLGRGVCSIQMKNGNQEFLYYLLKYVVNDIKNRESGTVFGSINRKDIEDIDVEIPKEIKNQIKISTILKEIDDKIELNNKINKNLEEQVFIQYSKITKSNVCSNILFSEVAEVSSGKRPTFRYNQKTREYNIPIIGATSIMAYTNDYNCNEKVLIAGRVGTHGVIQRYNIPIWASDNTLIIKSKFYEFIYQVLKNIDWNSMNRGSTQPLITQSDLKNINIHIPNQKLLNDFESTAHLLMFQYDKLNIENQLLINLRNYLLPKLMSGEIDVSKIDI